MTNTNSAAPTAPIVHEAPSLLRLWWKNKKLQYHIDIARVIIILNIQAIVYMRIYKLHFREEIFVPLCVCYLFTGIVSCVCWLLGIKEEPPRDVADIYGWMCHFIGFALLHYILYCISPLLSLLFGLDISLPCLVWLIIGSTVGKAICKGLRDWWRSVNQPQLVVETSQGDVPV